VDHPGVLTVFAEQFSIIRRNQGRPFDVKYEWLRSLQNLLEITVVAGFEVVVVNLADLDFLAYFSEITTLVSILRSHPCCCRDSPLNAFSVVWYVAGSSEQNFPIGVHLQ
jgi:hypothetical protein